MSTPSLRFIPVVSLLLGLHAPAAFAQPVQTVQTARSAPSAPSTAERLHANALASFQQARFPEAYGRFIALANAGHAPSAEVALWMYLHGPTVFGREWDSTPEQLTAWARMAGQEAPTLVGRSDSSSAAQAASAFQKM
jgi:hypothetical protein